MYSAICPGCGDLLVTNIGGQVWIGCQNCHFHGQLITTPTPPSIQGAAAPMKNVAPPGPAGPATSASSAQRTLVCPACAQWTDPGAAQAEASRLGRATQWGVCPTCGYGWRVMPALPPVPSLNNALAGTLKTPPAQPAPTTQPSAGLAQVYQQLAALAGQPAPTSSLAHERQIGPLDISGFADELYAELLATPAAAFNAALPAAWERLQEALDALHTALGGRHMGDYAPSEEPVVAAVTRVSVAALLTLWAVAQMRQRELEERLP